MVLGDRFHKEMESSFLLYASMLHVFMPYNKLLVCIPTIYLNKLKLGLDMYVCMYSLPFG